MVPTVIKPITTARLGHFEMSENLRLTLPVELLTIISSLVRKADLPSLALANKRMNQITTPYLYTELDLFTYGSARHCLIVLNLPPVTLPFPGRVLAECIQSFRLRITCFQYNPGTTDNVEMLGLLLARIMPRMVNLRKLDIGPWSLTSAALVLKALVTHPYPRLQSAHLCLFSSTRNAAATDNLAALQVVPLSYPQHPPLQTLAVTSLSSLSQHNHAHLCALLSSTAGSLQRLSLTMEKTADLRAVFPVNATFPVLEHLEVTVRDFNDPICTALTHIRSLAIKSQGLVITPPGPVLTTAYPVLEELACMHSQVALFLGPDIHPRRPVHTVELDYTKYERNGGETTEDTPRWKDVLFAFEHLQFSAVPIRHLRFYVNRLLIPALQVAMSEFPSLESLTMVVWHEPKRDALFALGEWVFARLPRLHTFLLGDVVKKQHDHRDHFWFARDVAMQKALLGEYEQHTSALKRVAFTTEFEWEKGSDGLWYTTDLIDVEVQEEPEDSGDETESSFDSDVDDDDDDDEDNGD